MKFFVNRILLNHKGQYLMDGKTEAASVPLTLGALAVEALLREAPQDNGAPGNTKIARWRLAKELHKHLTPLIHDAADYQETVEKIDQKRYVILKTEEVNLIKSRIQQGFPAVVAGPAEEAIEGELPEPAAEIRALPDSR